jgi:hypothetical protein
MESVKTVVVAAFAALRPHEGPRGPAPSRCSWLRVGAGYGAALVISLMVLAVVLRLWRQDLRVPLIYNGDVLLYLGWMRTALDEGWYLTSARLGAPGAMDLSDFPLADGLHFGIIKLIGLVVPNVAAGANIYYLLTFPLTALASLFALRQLGIAYTSALMASLLYTFLPYHFFRIGHPFLAAYYLVPLVALLLIRLHGGWSPSLRSGTQAEAARPRRAPIVASVLLCLLVGSAGVYYAFFACFFFVVVGLHAGLMRRSIRPVAQAGLWAGLVTLGLAVNLAPHLIGQARQGANPLAVARTPEMAETFALKPVQLLLPMAQHRVPALARLKEKYNSTAPLVNENDSSSLGIIGALGFLFLLGRLFWRRQDWARPDLLGTLGLLTAAGLALAVVGGGGTVFSYLVSPMIRAYCRITIYLAFFALAAVAWAVERCGRNVFAWVGAAALLLVGLADQTSPAFIPDAASQKRYATDAAYFRAVEAAMPPGAMVFQLPIVPYPEAAPVYDLKDHDHLRAYLHTRHVHWSYGAIRGRENERWQVYAAALPPDRMVRLLIDAGFAGIYVNRSGFADRAARLEQSLRSVLGAAPLASADGDMLFFNLMPYRNERDATRTPEERSMAREQALNPIGVQYDAGFWGPESDGNAAWQWCAGTGDLYVTNPLPYPRRVVLRAGIQIARPAASRLRIIGPAEEVALEAGDDLVDRACTLLLPPGRHAIRLVSDVVPVTTPSDRRARAFRLVDLDVADEPLPAHGQSGPRRGD